MNTMQKLLALIVLGVTARAQAPSVVPWLPPNVNRYQVQATTTALTIQQPSTNGNQVLLELANVACDSDSTVTFSWSGTAATATTATPVKFLGVSATARATAWSGSNAGAGTTGRVDSITGGAGPKAYDLTMFIVPTGSTANNFTMTTSNSCSITIQWREQ